MSDEIYLEPCPFCGGKPRSDLNKKTHCQLHGYASQSVRIYCYHECPARPSVSAGDVYNGGINKATVEAANAWNTRADTSAAQVAAAYERAADLCVDQFQAHLDLVITGNPDNARNRESAANMAEKLSHEIRALATDTQTDALEQVRREAERVGYERGVREAAEKAKIHLLGQKKTLSDKVVWSILSLMTPDEQTEAARELAFRKAVSS